MLMTKIVLVFSVVCAIYLFSLLAEWFINSKQTY